MKKVSAILVALLLVATTAITAFAAGINADEQKVLDAVSGTVDVNGTEVSWPAAFVNQAENYFNTADLTAKQADAIVAEINAAKSILKEKNITNISAASEADKKELFATLKNAAAVIGGTATYDRTTGEVTITDANGEVLIKVVPTLVIKGQDQPVDSNGNATDGGVIKTTGTGVNTTMIVVLSAAAAVVIAGGILFVVKKRA